MSFDTNGSRFDRHPMMDDGSRIAFVKDDILSSGRSNDSRFKAGRSQQPITKAGPSSAQGNTMSAIPSSPHEISTSQAVSTSGHAADELSSYQVDLKQKDELIAALIHELEKAVEQLDRFERSGAERSHSGLSSSLPSSTNDFAESRSPLMDDLRQMAEEWGQAQPASTLSRIESQLAAVHDLILNLQRNDRPRADFTSVEDRVRQIYHESAETPEEDPCNMTLDESSPTWDTIKNQMFATEAATPSVCIDGDDSEILRFMLETPTPTEVNFAEASVDDLKKAIVERDSYIIQLNRLCRMRNLVSLPTDWAELANVPSEMQIRVATVLERLDVQVRLGEVEMSLERARLARERSLIQSEREMIEKHMKRLGLSSLAELDNISAATGTATERRWMRFLGPTSK